MIIKSLLNDRKTIVAALERETGKKAVYCGAPTFRYQIGDYTVLRDGSLEADDHAADLAFLDSLAAQGLLEKRVAPQGGIAFSTKDFSGRTMVNLVNIFAARGNMINKAIGVPNAFHMSAELVRKLKDENPTDLQSFLTILYNCGGERAVKGLWITSERLFFTGFPETDTCRQLAERIVHAACTNRWSKAQTQSVTNEKYSFRVWLNSLGLKGPAYSAARAELLKNFTGDGSFRTEEQRAAFYAARKRSAPEPDFVLL